MKYFYLLVLFPFYSLGQNADWKELQDKINSAVKENKALLITRNYTIDKPLIIENWEGNEYRPVSIQIQGDATMWDVNRRSVITASFKDAPVICIQLGKDVKIRGINFRGGYKPTSMKTPALYNRDFDNYGDSTCRSERFSPYTAIAIDPFAGKLPDDGGYPGLKRQYRGKDMGEGSQNIVIEDCTFHGFTVGAIVSPNGNIVGGDIHFRNIRIGTSKVGIACGGGNSRLNTMTNIGAWGTTFTVFDFAHFGSAAGGNWSIDGVNIAGDVVRIIERNAKTNYKLTLKNLFAESIGLIGNWTSAGNDVLLNSSVNLRYVQQTESLPEFVLKGNGVTISNSTFRYYGDSLPMIIIGNVKLNDNNYGNNYPIFLQDNDRSVKIKSSKDFSATVSGRQLTLKGTARPGDAALFFKDEKYVGSGVVVRSDRAGILIDYLSHSVQNGKLYKVVITGKDR